MTVSLYNALKSSYGDKKAKNNLEKEGYQMDSSLSNHNQQVWYNPNDKKVMVNVAGTHNLKDWGTDLYLGLGLLKSTNRYKQAKSTLEKAKTKYQPAQTVVTGHSLGSSIGSYIADKNDMFYGLDGGYTIGQKTRSRDGNHKSYRTSGDVVSLLGAGAKHMTTLDNPNKTTGILPLDALKAHDIENIKNTNLYI
jgi:hypothetical protein